MTVITHKINGTTYLCVVTPYEKSRINRGESVNIPADHRTKLRLGIPRAIQLKNAGIAAPPVVF